MFDVDRFYTAAEVVRESEAPRAMVYDALRSGELRSIRRGRRFLVPGACAVEWIAGIVGGEASARPETEGGCRVTRSDAHPADGGLASATSPNESALPRPDP